jgi:PAS domain S-box-containing protein
VSLGSTTVSETNHDAERRLSKLLHDLRTPLNHIIGLSEMLLESAEQDGHRDLVEGLSAVREAGIELATLLQDGDIISTTTRPDGEFWPLSDAVRTAASRVLGFTDLVLGEPPTPRLDSYREDLVLIRSAGQTFIELARHSDLFIQLESSKHWDARSPVGRTHALEHSSGGRILIVDDESLNREVLCRRLQREGYRPAGVRSGPEALHLLQTEPFDVILLDIVMPEMSGMEVLQALKQDPQLRHLPVIMLSALTDVDRVARCVELGAEDYLPKPINAVLLRARLGACLEKKRLRDQEQAHFRAIHAETERLSVTLRSLADAVVTTDATGRVLLFNEIAEKLTGVSNADAAGRPFDEVFPMVHRATGKPAANLAAEALGRNAVVESESGLALHAPDGREQLVAARAAPIHDHAGGAIGTVVVVRDITEKEKMAEELLRSSKLQSIGALAGGLAHDFNNMLTAVLGNLSLLQHRQTFPPDLLLSIQEAERGALRAQELTRYLLTFAAGGAPMKRVLQAATLVEESCALVLRGSHVECEFRLPEGLWATEADRDQISQALGNVVLNALEATADGGRIVVRAENVSTPLHDAPYLPPGDYLRIVVQDFGAGIPPEHLSRIYDPFFTTKKQARGLGLAAAYSIIQRHAGHISVESVLNAGTTVIIHLPACLTGAPAPSVESTWELPPTPPLPEDDHPQRVLVMDDEEPIRQLITIMLRMLNCDVVSTEDGEAALAAHAEALAAGQPFDIVVMDLTIPGGMGGKETIRRLREKDTTIRAIVSSGYSNDPVMANYADYGFDAVLPKPYALRELRRVVESVRARFSGS